MFCPGVVGRHQMVWGLWGIGKSDAAPGPPTAATCSYRMLPWCQVRVSSPCCFMDRSGSEPQALPKERDSMRWPWAFGLRLCNPLSMDVMNGWGTQGGGLLYLMRLKGSLGNQLDICLQLMTCPTCSCELWVTSRSTPPLLTAAPRW